MTYYEKSEEKRAEYLTRINRIPPEKRVYVDESGVNTFLQREYGRALRGEIIEDVKRGNKFERVNVIGALCNNEYYAVECYNHSTNSDYFENWFVDNLLQEIPNGYTVIMDNARFHPKQRLRKLARGKVLYIYLNQFIKAKPVAV